MTGCRVCENPVKEGDEFCAQCGAALRANTPASDDIQEEVAKALGKKASVTPETMRDNLIASGWNASTVGKIIPSDGAQEENSVQGEEETNWWPYLRNMIPLIGLLVLGIVLILVMRALRYQRL